MRRIDYDPIPHIRCEEGWWLCICGSDIEVNPDKSATQEWGVDAVDAWLRKHKGCGNEP